MTTMRLLTLFATLTSLLNLTSAFSPRVNLASTTSKTRPLAAPSNLLLHSTPNGDDADKQAEIAALEEKLRQLKGESDANLVDNAYTEPSYSVAVAKKQLIDDDDEDAYILEGESEDSVMFSERWKEADATQQQQQEGGGLMKAGMALGLIVFLAIFSQIPVGEEDLTRYQGKKGDVSRIDLGDLNPGVRVQ